MPSVSKTDVEAALGTVNDPEIKRPITEINMVEAVEIEESGQVTVKVLLTVAGCPLKDTITRDVTNGVSKVAGASGVTVDLGVLATTLSVSRRSRSTGTWL